MFDTSDYNLNNGNGNMVYDEFEDPNIGAKIKVVGVGGGGNNAVNRMIEAGLSATEFISVNTDAQALRMSKASRRVQIGKILTKGLGAGSNPEVGAKAAEESKDAIEAFLKDTDLLFIAAGMGGGTGSGAAPVIARIAKEMGILTVAVVTKPFAFEGKRRDQNAKVALAALKKYVDTLIVIPNDKLLLALPKDTAFSEAFRHADEVLRQGVSGVVDLITTPSLINLDFADVSTIMRGKGLAHIGIGKANGEHRVMEAVRQAVSSPLLETTIEGAGGVILNVIGGMDMTLGEASEAAELVQGVVDKDANIIFGARIDPTISDEIQIIVIATGFQGVQQVIPERKSSDTVVRDFGEPVVKETFTVGEVPLRQEEEKESVRFDTISSQPKVTVEPKPETVRDDIPSPRLQETKKEVPSFIQRLFKGKK